MSHTHQRGTQYGSGPSAVRLGLAAAVSLCLVTAGVAQDPGSIELPRTGQTTTYAVGDDGDLQEGVVWPAPRFTDHGDGSVTDTLTGLMWAQDFNLMRTRDPAFDDEGFTDGAVRWYRALEYVDLLNSENYLGHADWHMPNVLEFMSLIAPEERNPALPQGHPFTNVFNSYWTSTTHSTVSTSYVVFLSDVFSVKSGDIEGGSKREAEPLSPERLVPVRVAGGGAVSVRRTGQEVSYAAGDDGDLRAGARAPAPRFVDHGNGTTGDRLTGLMWTTHTRPAGVRQDWQAGLDYVAGMNDGTNENFGHTDWRMANWAEATSVVDFGRSRPAFPPGHPFVLVDNKLVWTSTTIAGDATRVRLLNPNSPRPTTFPKTWVAAGVWPVRSDASPLSGNAIRGRVVQDGAGVRGVRITLDGPLDGATYTDEDGYYECNFLAVGSYTVTPSARYRTFTPLSQATTLTGSDAVLPDFDGAYTQTHGWEDRSERLAFPSSDFRSVHFVGDRGWVTSATWPEIYHTTDGGETWAVQTTTEICDALFMRSATEGYAGGIDGAIFRTTDGGADWTEIGSLGGGVRDIHFPPTGDTGYCCGQDGRIASIVGNVVTPMATDLTNCLDGIHFPVDATTGWVTGGNQMARFSGGTWTRDQVVPPAGLGGIHFVNATTGWAVGWPRVFRTTNGVDWTEQAVPADPANRTLQDVFFLDENEGFAVGLGGAILHTTDGATWAYEAEGLAVFPLWSVHAVDTDTAWAVGGSTLLKYVKLTDNPVEPPPPPGGTVTAFILPKTIKVKANAKKPAKSSLVTVGFFDTGPDPVDLSGAATLYVAGLEFAIPALEPLKNGSFRHRADGVQLTIKPGKNGSSKGKFKLKVVSADVAGIDQNAEVVIRFKNAAIDGSGKVTLTGGKYKLGKARGALVEPLLYLFAFKAGLKGAGKDKLTLKLGLATDGGTPAAAPEVTIAWGNTFSETVPAAAFSPKGDVYRYKGDKGALTSVVVDYRRETLTAKGKGLDLGLLADGAHSAHIEVTLAGDTKAVEVRCVKKGKNLKY